MKKLIGWELAMIAMTGMVVIAGHLFGWSREVTAIVAGALVFAVAFVSVVDTAFAAAAPAFAATAAFVSVSVFFAFAFAIAIATFATLAADLPEDAKLKYHWVLGSLLAEGLAVWAILMYL